MPYNFTKIFSKYSTLNSSDDFELPFDISELKSHARENQGIKHLYLLLKNAKLWQDNVKLWQDQEAITPSLLTEKSIQRYLFRFNKYLISKYPEDQDIVNLCSRFINPSQIERDCDDEQISSDESDGDLMQGDRFQEVDLVDNIDREVNGDQDRVVNQPVQVRANIDPRALPVSFYSSIVDHRDSESFLVMMKTFTSYVIELTKILEKNVDDQSRFVQVKNSLMDFPGIDHCVAFQCVAGSQQRIADALLKIKRIPLVAKIIEEEIIKGFIEFGDEVQPGSQIHFKSCLLSLVSINKLKDQFKFTPDEDIELSKAFKFMTSFKQNFLNNLEAKFQDYFQDLQAIVQASQDNQSPERFAKDNLALVEFCERINFDLEINQEQSKIKVDQLFSEEFYNESGFIWSNLISKDQFILMLKGYFDAQYSLSSDHHLDYLDFFSIPEFPGLFDQDQNLDPSSIEGLKDFLLTLSDDSFADEQRTIAKLLVMNILARDFHGSSIIYFQQLINNLAEDLGYLASSGELDYRGFFQSFFSNLQSIQYPGFDQEVLGSFIQYLSDKKVNFDGTIDDIDTLYQIIYLKKYPDSLDDRSSLVESIFNKKKIIANPIEDPTADKYIEVYYLAYAVANGHDQVIDFILENEPNHKNPIQLIDDLDAINLMFAMALNRMSTFKKIIRIYHEAIDKILSDQTSDDEKD